MLQAQAYSGFANTRLIRQEQQSQSKRIEQILRTAELLEPMDAQFAGFFKNWKIRWYEAGTLEAKKAALRWLLRKLKEVDSRDEVQVA